VKKLIRKIVNLIGYEIVKKTNGRDGFEYDFEHNAKEAIAVILQNTMVSFEPLITLYQQVRHCEINNILGDFVECGVWKGGAVGLMALANMKFNQSRRHIHMFDVFDDICEPDPAVDGVYAINQIAELAKINAESLQGNLKPVKGVYDSHGGHGTVNIVKQLLEDKIGYDKRFLHYYQGWFQETLPFCKDKINEIAILRLDGDLYASTKVCLDFLYSKVVTGGFVIIDDYGAYEGCKKAVDEFRDKYGIKTFINHVNHDCRYWIK
jgi:O-methyltransferase